MVLRRNKKNELVHDKTYNKTCANSKDWDQPAHPHSLIRVFPDHMCLLQTPGYPKRDEQGALVDVQANLSLCCSQRSSCRFCSTLAQISIFISLKKGSYLELWLLTGLFIEKSRTGPSCSKLMTSLVHISLKL